MARVILVTGANQGIGFEIVRQLAQQGHTVFLGARSVEKGKEAVAQLHKDNLTTVRALTLDVTSQDSVNAAVKDFSAHHAHLDVLVNNAGIAPEGFAQNADAPNLDLMHATFETNFFGVARVCGAFVPLLRKSQNPVVLNVSSSLGSITRQTGGVPGNPPSVHIPGYNSSKSALNAYTVMLSHAFPEARVNAINPGYVATNLNSYKGKLTTKESAEGVIKYGILLDKAGPTASFLDYSGTTLPW
eukprot:Phypoly_transcript_16880.p1 GENE.Phypoly_transcript_16880~~Phypoly_transcript_16880.p1  ORF type:complete len:244 (+),score=46.63 Phypoly_transcript_16880:87-818(+)